MKIEKVKVGQIVVCEAIGDTYTDRKPYYGKYCFKVVDVSGNVVRLDIGHGATQKVGPEDICIAFSNGSTKKKNSVFSQVKALLQEFPKFREDRDALIAEVLSRNNNLDLFEAAIVQKHFKQAVLIDRYWRQVQQKDESLRGPSWLKRQALSLKKKIELGYKVKKK